MKLNNEDFDLMLNAAWSAFENTLKVWGLTDKQLDKFTTLMAKQAFEKGKNATCFDLWFRPKWKFFRDYILKLGFLDGYSGYQVCKLSAFATFLKYSKIKEYNK